MKHDRYKIASMYKPVKLAKYILDVAKSLLEIFFN